MSKVPDQTDVRTRGGQTTVKLTAAGTKTLDRIYALCDELASNPAVKGLIADTIADLQLAADEAGTAINGSLADQGEVLVARAKRREALKAAS